MAAFLLGLPTDGGYDVNGSRTNQSNYYAFFLQDDYRVKSNLTLNLGIRVEHETGTTERYDRTVNGFDTTTPSPIAAQAIAAYAANPISEIPVSQFKVNGGLLFANPSRREIYSTPGATVSPRFGLAWSPFEGKTVIRAGFGIYYFTYGVIGNNQPGFSQTTPITASLDGFLTPNATLANPFPNGILQPTGSAAGLGTFLGRSITFFNPEAKSHYSMRGQFSIQREVARNLLVEVGYMYNKGVRLVVDQNINGLPLQQLEWNLRTFPTRFPSLRQDGVQQIDFSIIKAFQITERVAMTYRCEFFNSTNRPIFSAPNLQPTATNFGLITNQANQPRRIQMALRLVF